MPDSARIPSAAGDRRRRRQRCESLPSGILLNSDAYIGSRPNNTTAIGDGRDNLIIEASLWLAPPPLPSNLYVCCHGASYPHASTILYTAEDLILFSVPVAVGPPPVLVTFHDCDYMIYRAGRPPSLTRLPIPNKKIYDGRVGLLPRAGDLFTAASLVGRKEGGYTLRRFDSEVGYWTKKIVCLEAPRKPYQIQIPKHASRLNYHITTTVITLGGESGTMGWVDLWSGILVYDLLHDEDHQNRPAMVRHMPLPVPPLSLRYSLGRVLDLGCPRSSRGIASIIRHGQPCLKLAHLEIIEQRLPYDDIETDMPCYKVENWAVTTWTNIRMGYSFEDWQEDFTVWASEITMSETLRSELEATGLLHHEPSDCDEVAMKLALQNLVVSEPTPSLNGDEDVIYLMARPKRFYHKAWTLALDMKNRTLLGVSEFGESESYPGVRYCSSAISNYLR